MTSPKSPEEKASHKFKTLKRAWEAGYAEAERDKVEEIAEYIERVVLTGGESIAESIRERFGEKSSGK